MTVDTTPFSLKINGARCSTLSYLGAVSTLSDVVHLLAWSHRSSVIFAQPSITLLVACLPYWARSQSSPFHSGADASQSSLAAHHGPPVLPGVWALYALTLIITLDLSTPKMWPLISGWWAPRIAIAGVLGPILGGVLTEYGKVVVLAVQRLMPYFAFNHFPRTQGILSDGQIGTLANIYQYNEHLMGFGVLFLDLKLLRVVILLILHSSST